MKIITNSIGATATSMTAAGSGIADASGYSMENVVSGPRSTMYRSAATTSPIRVAYNYSAAMDADHMVIARADKLLTAGTMKLTGKAKNSGGTWIDNPGAAIKDPIAVGDLVGPPVGTKTTGQDFVYDFGSTQSYYGFGIQAQTKGGTAEALMVSKVYFGMGIDLGDPEAGAQWENVGAKDRFLVPPRGSFQYETEKQITLVWKFLSKSTVNSFLYSTANVLNWPVFLYDPNQYLWAWKLEHVLVAGWQLTLMGPDLYQLAIGFRRLKHYD